MLLHLVQHLQNVQPSGNPPVRGIPPRGGFPPMGGFPPPPARGDSALFPRGLPEGIPLWGEARARKRAAMHADRKRKRFAKLIWESHGPELPRPASSCKWTRPGCRIIRNEHCCDRRSSTRLSTECYPLQTAGDLYAGLIQLMPSLGIILSYPVGIPPGGMPDWS